MRVLFSLVLVCVLLLLPAFSQEQSALSSTIDLSELQARFQTILDEIGNNDNAFESSSAANLLIKVDNLQRSQDTQQNISLDWFSRNGRLTSAPWMTGSLRIVLVVSSFEGMYLNSGIGTFYAALSDFLVRQGHSVTILYTRADNSTEKLAFERWKSSFEKRGVKVVRLEASRVKVTVSLLSQKSYQVYRYLKDHQEDFDAVHFPEWEGPGYFTTLAKHEGLAFLDKILIVGIHGPWRWVKSGNNKGEKGMLSMAEDFETDWLERKSVEYADVVFTPSLDLVQWLSAQGWAFPSYEKNSLYLMPFLPGREITKDLAKGKNSNDVKDGTTSSVTELVFFGRLEKRKGLELFVDALDKLTLRRPEFQEDLKITFLGRSSNIGSQSSMGYLEQRSANWPFKVTYINHKDRKGALEYLRADKGRVAIIPSLIDNAPYTAYECLFLAIPFVATNIPSINALVHTDDRLRVLSNLDAGSLSVKLEAVLDNGAQPVRSAFNMEKATDAWIGFYEVISENLKDAKAKSQLKEDEFQPLVTICITHYNRPELLKMTLDSVENQVYKNFEVILVDDGSSSAAAVTYIDSLKPSFGAKGWKIVKTRNQYLGAARNAGSRLARGEYILFLDDDNLGKPEQISTYVKVAGATDADVLTAVHDVFKGTGLPDSSPESTNIISRSVPIGASPALGIFKNCFGDANFFIRKSTFMQIGGFTEEKNVGQEDHEFLAKAVLEGHLLLPIPEVLLYYRMHNKSDQMIYNTDPIKNHLRSKRPYSEGASEEDSVDLLKILALDNQRSSRSARGALQACNMTVHSVTPDRIPEAVITGLSFTVSNVDCTVSLIHIGRYICSDPIVTDASHILCESPSISVAGNYEITFTYKEEPGLAVDTALLLEIYALGSPDDYTKAVTSLEIEPSPTYSSQGVLNDAASITGTSPSAWSMTTDATTPGSNRKRESQPTVLDLRLTVFSTDASFTAAQIMNYLCTALADNPDLMADMGTIVSANTIQTCDSADVCTCTPSYQGAGCDTVASCPNNCSSNGVCETGQYVRVCNCNQGFTGTDCSLTTCSDECSLHGTCVTTYEQNSTCKCNPGWVGGNCTQVDTSCASLNCSANSVCSSGKCLCNPGYTGTDCSTLSLNEEVGSSSPSATTGSDPSKIAFAVIVAIIGFILVVIAGVAIYFYYKRHKHETQYL